MLSFIAFVHLCSKKSCAYILKNNLENMLRSWCYPWNNFEINTNLRLRQSSNTIFINVVKISSIVPSRTTISCESCCSLHFAKVSMRIGSAQNLCSVLNDRINGRASVLHRRDRCCASLVRSFTGNKFCNGCKHFHRTSRKPP